MTQFSFAEEGVVFNMFGDVDLKSSSFFFLFKKHVKSAPGLSKHTVQFLILLRTSTNDCM